MKCPKCGSEFVTVSMENTQSKTQKKGNSIGRKALHGAVRGTMGLATLGVSNLFIPKHLEGKEVTKNKFKKYCICQECGKSWTI